MNLSIGSPTRKTLITIGITVAVGAVGYFLIVKPVLCKLGVVTCRKQRKQDKQILENFDNKGFDPNYWKTKNVTIQWDRARKLAEDVYNAAGTFNDDEGPFYALLQEVNTYANLSLVSYVFQNKYKESLAEWYSYYLDEPTEQAKIKRILEELK